jgi:hypothetical protein
MGKIPRDVAEAEIKAWLDKKKVFEETRERYKDHIEILIEGMCNAVISINQETFEITHALLFPTGDSGDGLKELKYKPRINDKALLPHMKGVKNDDVDMRLNALLAALTNESKAVICSLDSVDKRIATAIGIFFM